MNAQSSSSFGEHEHIHSPNHTQQQQQPHVPTVPIQSPPIHHVMQQHPLLENKQELPVRNSNK
jgi:hypothetical protein